MCNLFCTMGAMDWYFSYGICIKEATWGTYTGQRVYEIYQCQRDLIVHFYMGHQTNAKGRAKN